MADQKQEVLNLQVNVPEHLKTGTAANIALITATANGEVILDFVFTHPNDKIGENQQGTLVSRIVLPIKVAKDLNLILGSITGKSHKE